MDSVKAYLSYVLLRASVSQSPTIFQVSNFAFWNYAPMLLMSFFFWNSSMFKSLIVVHIIWQYATGIFSVLLLRFRECLKVCCVCTSYWRLRYIFQNFERFANYKIYFQGEIGIFFPLIVLRPLDGTDLNAKMSVPRYDFCLKENSFYTYTYTSVDELICLYG